MSVRIILVSGETTFDAKKLQTVFPENIISQALEMSHDTEIKFEKPFMTPRVMQIIGDLLLEVELKTHEPDLAEASRFLNMPKLEAYVSPLFELIDHKEIQSIRNKRVFAEALTSQKIPLVMYLLDLGLIPCFGEPSTPYLANLRIDVPMIGQWPIAYAAEKGLTSVVARLLQHLRVNPQTNMQKPMELACNNGYTAVVKLLLKDPRIEANFKQNLYFDTVVRLNFPDLVRLFLADGRFDPMATMGTEECALTVAVRNGALEILELLLDHPLIIPSVFGNKPIRIAIQNGFLEVCRLLLKHPEMQQVPRSVMQIALKTECPEIIALLQSRIDYTNPIYTPTYGSTGQV